MCRTVPRTRVDACGSLGQWGAGANGRHSEHLARFIDRYLNWLGQAAALVHTMCRICANGCMRLLMLSSEWPLCWDALYPVFPSPPLPLLPSKQKKLKSQLTPRNLLWPSSGSIFWDTGVANRELIQVGTEKHVAPDTHIVSVFPSRKNQLARSYSIPMYYFIIYTHIIYSVRTWIRGGAFGEQFKHPQTEPLLLAFFFSFASPPGRSKSVAFLSIVSSKFSSPSHLLRILTTTLWGCRFSSGVSKTKQLTWYFGAPEQTTLIRLPLGFHHTFKVVSKLV